MSGLVKDFFSLNLVVMRILGFYPPVKYKGLYKIFANIIYWFCTVPVPTLASIHLMVGENVDIVEICDNSFMIIQVGCFIFKLLPFIHNGDEVRKSIYMVENSIFTNYTKKQRKFIDECKIICHQITWLFFGFCILSQIFFATTPLFGHGRKLPVEIWLPFDAKLKMPTYVGSYIFVTIGVGNGAGSNGVIDPLIAGLACYGATQLRILQDNLQHLDEYVNAEISNQGFSEAKNVVETKYLKDKVLYKKITHCIEHHNAIFNFIQNYENVYSSVVFTQFAASILVICLCCWQLIMVEPFTYKFFFMVCFLLTMLLEVFLYCYFGTTLFEESNNVTTAIYMSNWYDYDINSKKALMVLMERSQTPMIVTAGKILDLSLVTFTTILRRAYSLLAVLKNY